MAVETTENRIAIRKYDTAQSIPVFNRLPEPRCTAPHNMKTYAPRSYDFFYKLIYTI